VGGLIEYFQDAASAVWLDDALYAERLLAAGETPWLDSGEYVSFRRQAAALLKSDILALSLGRATEAWVRAHPGLGAAMAAKKRNVAPLRVLLGDTDLRAHLLDLAQGLHACFLDVPFVLTLPSPPRWVTDAHRLAHGAESELAVGEDETDSAAVYIADFLREFAEVGCAGILLEESTDSTPRSADEIEWYRPVINVAEHYRWDIGLRTGNGAPLPPGSGPVSFTIAAQTTSDGLGGVAVTADFWDGAAVPEVPAGGFLFAEIPPDGRPETILERIAELHA